MPVKLQWQKPDQEIITKLEQQGLSSNLLQSPLYARALLKTTGQEAVMALAFKNEKPIGYALASQTGTLGGFLNTIVMDRGPVWMKGEATKENIESFFSQFSENYPPRFGRMRRVIPELPKSPDALNILKKCGLKRAQGDGYKTIIMNIEKPEEDLLASTKKNWRGALKKGQRESENENVKLFWDKHGKTWPLFARKYQIDRKIKKYNGPSLKLSSALVQEFAANDQLLIGMIEKDKKAAAGILILCHGNSATYLIGWSEEAGREICAHHFLLWEAIKVLKQRQIRYLDLGGINEEGATGVTEFKKGLAGKKAEILELCGLYS